MFSIPPLSVRCHSCVLYEDTNNKYKHTNYFYFHSKDRINQNEGFIVSYDMALRVLYKSIYRESHDAFNKTPVGSDFGITSLQSDDVRTKTVNISESKVSYDTQGFNKFVLHT